VLIQKKTRRRQQRKRGIDAGHPVYKRALFEQLDYLCKIFACG